ncbi:MAG: DUF1972 domain-containing protein, partial [Candidatus Dadabacteria bacterium]
MLKKDKLSIAILGTRGIPAAYGGFETFAENISKLLVNDGHKVAVFCRRRLFKKNSLNKYCGVKLVHLPTIYNKYLETVVHSIVSYLY